MTLWGGRFTEPLSQVVWDFTSDPADRRLLLVDIHGSIAHVRALDAAGLVSDEEARDLVAGLEQMSEEAAAGRFTYEPTDEDVHTAVERRLVELVGDVGNKVHTGRSRNDQVALDLRLYLVAAATGRMGDIDRLVSVLADRAEQVADVVVPSYTHLQQAQPVSLGHPLAAYAWMLLRDRERFADAAGRIGVSPLGAGAGGGSTLSLRPDVAAAEAGFEAVFTNSLDAVASRDFVAEYVFACAQLMAHLSRFAEDLVLWSSAEFAWITIPDSHATGSSALPHKKNPDVAELVRSRAAVVLGDLVTMLAMQKGLPLAYNRDLQEDKRAVFHADDTAAGSLVVLTELVGVIEFHPPHPAAETVAMVLAERLVSRGVPFRDAHRQVGALLSRLDVDGRSLGDVGEEDVEGSAITLADIEPSDPDEAARSLRSPGSGSPQSVLGQVKELRRRLDVAQPSAGMKRGRDDS
ncbi:MAG: argininosuccinate lyase [Acidimicrobiia bacterium]|nr:MAG: argininosuccinate lyase [Acidimicrobiia bacterium]